MPIDINTTYQSPNHRPRGDENVLFLVMHYTAAPLNATLGMFTNNYELASLDLEYYNYNSDELIKSCQREVSSHYVIGENAEIYQLVDEKEAAYHAGVSFWDGYVNINNKSIGIEHVNPGYEEKNRFPTERGVKVDGSDNMWCQYTESQIVATIELCKGIVQKYNIKPYNVIGHGDVAASRKVDPGPLFPWKRLADAGIGIWYDVNDSSFNDENMPENHIKWMQYKLSEFGYDCDQTGILDNKTVDVIKAFQMHFRQTNISGYIDSECIQILDSLCKRKQQLKLDDMINNKLTKIKLRY